MSENNGIISYATSLADAEAPTALPGGDYPATIIAAVRGPSQSSGKDQVKVTFRIEPEDYPADYEDAASYPEGKEAQFYVPAEEDRPSMFRMRKFLEAIGMKLGKTVDHNEFVGRKAVVTNKPEEFEGIPRERITKVSAL